MDYSFQELEKKEWDKLERSHTGSHFFQSVQRVTKRQQMGYQNYIIGVKQGDKIVAGGVLMGRNGEFWMAYGPLIDWKNNELIDFFLKQTLNYSHEKGFIKIEIFPNLLLSTRDSKGNILSKFDQSYVMDQFLSNGFEYQGETIDYQMKAGRWSFIKDLTSIENIDQLRASYRKTLRARLRKTTGQVEFARLTREELPILIGLIDSSDNRNGVTGRELEYYQMMYDAFGEEAKFMVARTVNDKTPIAGAIFIEHGNEIVSYLSGMDRKYQDLNGRAWLQDFIMNECLGNETKRINFFWIRGDFSKNSLLEFKSGFGGFVEEYIGGFEKVIRPNAYLYRRLTRKFKYLINKYF